MPASGSLVLVVDGVVVGVLDMVANDIEVLATCDDIVAMSETLEGVGIVMTVVVVDTVVDERAILYEHDTLKS